MKREPGVTKSMFGIIGLYICTCMLLNSKRAEAQLQLSIDTIRITAVQSVYLSNYNVSFTVSEKNGLNVAWNSFVINNPTWVFGLNQSSGTTPTSCTLTPYPFYIVNHAPGTFYAKFAIYQTATSDTVFLPIKMVILPQKTQVNFSYISAPQNCHTKPAQQPFEIPFPDSAVCTVPYEKPLGNFTPPPVGGSYIDPNFGAKVTILSDSNHMNSYSSACALSPHNKYVFILSLGGPASIVDANTGEIIRDNIPGNAQKWDAYNDSLMYWADGDSLAVYKYNFLSQRKEKLVDFSKAPYNFTSLYQGGYGDNSKDNWMAFISLNEHIIGALDLNTRNTYTTDYTLTQGNIPYGTSGHQSGVFIAKGIDAVSGLRYVILQANTGALGLFSVNTSTQKLDYICRGSEYFEYSTTYKGNLDCKCDSGEQCIGVPHPDVFEGPDGIQYLTFVLDFDNPFGRSLVTVELNKNECMLQPVELGGGMRKVMDISKSGDPWADSHMGAAKQSPYFTLSIEYPTFIDSADHNTAPLRGAHIGEIIIVKALSGGNYEVRRLTQSLSVQYSNDAGYNYWSQPQACTSNDGSRVVYRTSFGIPYTGFNAPGLEVVSVETGYIPYVTSVDKKQDAEKETSLFPNPSEGVFQLKMEKQNGPVDLKVLNIQGQLVYEENLTVKTDGYSKQLDFSSYPKGIYFIQIFSDNFVKTQKVVFD